MENLNDLKGADYNPRRISPEGEKRLKKSLETFGDISGIVFNLKTGRLVSGHQRVTALKKAGAKLVKNKIVDKNGNEYPVRLVKWDENTEKAANLAANSPHIGGEFTEEVVELTNELQMNAPDLWDELELFLIEAEEELEEEEKQVEKDEEVFEEMELKPYESYDYVVFLFKDQRDFSVATNKLKLKKVNYAAKGGAEKIGLGRCLDGKKLLEILKNENIRTK